MDLPLALLMEQYLADRGAASVEDFARAFRVPPARCRDELGKLLAFGAELDARGRVVAPGAGPALRAVAA